MNSDLICALVEEDLLPTRNGTLLVLSVGADRGSFNNELPATSFLLALQRIRQAFLWV